MRRLSATSALTLTRRTISTSSSLRSMVPIDGSVVEDVKEIGLKSFMKKVYVRTGLGVGSTLGVALTLPLVMDINETTALITFGVGALTAFGSIFGISFSKPVYHTDNDGVHSSTNPTIREASYWGLTLGMGVMMTPFTNIIASIDPTILPVSLLITAGLFGGCAAFASSKHAPSSILQWKAPLMIGLGSLIVTQLVGIGATMIWGHENMLASLLFNVDIYGGIGLFTIMSVYDAYLAKSRYLKGKADDLGCSVDLYLDFMNLLIRIMEAMAKAKKN